MKAFASLLALAIALAPAAALAETAAPEAGIKTESPAPKKDAKKRQHAKTQPSRRAHTQQHKDVVTVSTRSVQKAPKESKSHGADKGPKKESKSDKKNDSKHPAGSAAFDHDHAAEPKSQLGSRGDGVKDLEPLPTPEVAPKASHPRSHGVKRVSLPEPKKVDDKAVEPTAAPKAPHKGKGAAKVAKAAAGAKTDAPQPKKCLKDAVTFLRGAEVDSFPLQQCDGTLAPLAVEHLSIMLRPHGVEKPVGSLERLAADHQKDQNLAANLRKIDARLITRLGEILEATHKGKAAKVSIVSGYRPQSQGSQHSLGRALDFRIDGVDNERIVQACKGMADVGCGFYPNSSFVHLDVRDAGTGHVSWIDASGPGEAPKYVTAWPPPAPMATAETPASEVKSETETPEPEAQK
jgi:hypothetical protein